MLTYSTTICRYSFGRIVVNGQSYSKDILVFPDGTVNDSWKRNKKYKISRDDINELIDSSPETIIIGTGFLGFMKPVRGLAEQLDYRFIELISARTGKAVTLFNDFRGNKNICGCFHLCC